MRRVPYGTTFPSASFAMCSHVCCPGHSHAHARAVAPTQVGCSGGGSMSTCCGFTTRSGGT